MAHIETTLDSTTIFEGKVIRVTVDTVELEDGSAGYREIVHHDGGACVLAVTDSDVSAPLRRSLQHRESGRVAIFNEYSAFLVDGLSEAGQVLDDSVAVDRRDDDSGDIILGKLGLHAVRAGLSVLARNQGQFDAVVAGVGLDCLDDVRKQGG